MSKDIFFPIFLNRLLFFTGVVHFVRTDLAMSCLTLIPQVSPPVAVSKTVTSFRAINNAVKNN